MKAHEKMVISFLILISVIMFQSAISYIVQKQIWEETRQINDIEAPLDLMSEKVIAYDAILTGEVHDTILYTETGDFNEINARKERYDLIGGKLDKLLKKDARDLLIQSRRPIETKNEVEMLLNDLDRINVLLVDLELKAFDALEKNDTDTAYSLVVGGDYEENKKELLNDYERWAEIEHEMTLNVRNDILNKSQSLIFANLIFSIISILIVIVSVFITRTFIIEFSMKK